MSKAADLTKVLCRRFEGLFLRVYLCPARVWSIGYGATFYLDGRAVGPADPPISRETAERLLDRQVTGIFLPGTLRLCPTIDTFGRAASLASFAFNLGLTRLKGSTLRRRVLAGDWEAAEHELLKWTRGGGRVLAGLVLRRQAEAALLRGAPQ